jgi:hypothetical protein
MPPPSSACAVPGSIPVRDLVAPGQEIGRRLARLLWRAEPDGPLLMRSLTLRTTADVAVQAGEMLNDPRSAEGTRALAKAWLHTDDALTATARAAAAPAATAQLRASMAQETEAFVHDLVSNGGSLQRLLTANDSFIDQPLADVYGLGTVMGFTHVMLNPSERSGILTHAGTLFAHPFATHRGQWIRGTLLCGEVPPPPPSMGAPIVVPPGQTYRQALATELHQPPCAACHQLVDPLGFALEHYDVLGRFRTTDNGLPVDSSAVILDLDNAMVSDARSLGEELASSCDVQLCVARTFVAHALGRRVDEIDAMGVAEVASAFSASGFNLRALLLATVQTPAFIKP